MFRSIEYKLIIYVVLLIISVVAAVYLIMTGEYIYGGTMIAISLFALNKLYVHYRKFNQNILFLLNALENGDYSFNFSEAKLSKRERELNRMMNRIKDILTKARKEVIENENFLSLIVESVSTGIIIFDQNNNVLITNRAVNQLLGLPIFTHLEQLKVIDKTFPEIFRSIAPNQNQTIRISTDREEVQISLQASQISLKRGTMKIVTLNNIGNELEAKEMESWIRLIRVMTHEIMNSIAPITSLTDTLLYSYKTDNNRDRRELLEKNTIESLQTINATAKGLLNFVDSYRRFSGIPKPQKSDFDLKLLADTVASLYRDTLNEKNINLEILSKDSPIIVNADESQISQILTNLIKNAIEAIGPYENGKMRIEISQTNGKTNIDVCNNGDPIPEDIVPHIFIPFFTTKDTGTGIGLSISRYIMRLHGGNLKHHTKDGYTIFSMTF